jgi:galactokinase
MLSKALNWSLPEITTTVAASPADGQDRMVHIEYPQLGLSELLKPPAYTGSMRVGKSYASGCLGALMARGIKITGLALRVESAVPMCGGLSSSAALCVALISAMTRMLGLDLERDEIAEMAFDAEQLMQIPCGRMDQYTVVRQELVIVDCTGGQPQVIPLTLAGDVSLAVGYGPGASSFSDQYPLVLTRWQEREQGVLSYLREIAAICDEMLSTSAAGGLSARRLGEATSGAHAAIVNHLRINNPQIDGWVSTALAAGAFGAKSCGARQSGGAVIAVCDDTTVEKVAGALAHVGASVVISRPGRARVDQVAR